MEKTTYRYTIKNFKSYQKKDGFHEGRGRETGIVQQENRELLEILMDEYLLKTILSQTKC